MKISRSILVAVMLFSGIQPCHSADANGRFVLGGGVGAVPCPEFVATMEKSRSLGIGSVGYANEMQGFIMYLLGFQTGYNIATKDTCDIFSGEKKGYPLLSWMENYCRGNPSKLFVNAVVALSIELHSKRQRVCY